MNIMKRVCWVRDCIWRWVGLDVKAWLAFGLPDQHQPDWCQAEGELWSLIDWRPNCPAIHLPIWNPHCGFNSQLPPLAGTLESRLQRGECMSKGNQVTCHLSRSHWWFVAIRFDFWIQGNRNVQAAHCSVWEFKAFHVKWVDTKLNFGLCLCSFLHNLWEAHIADLFLFNLHCRGRRCPGLHWSRLAPRDIPLLRSSCTRLKFYYEGCNGDNLTSGRVDCSWGWVQVASSSGESGITAIITNKVGRILFSEK